MLDLLLIEDSPSDARLLKEHLEEGFLGAGRIEHERTLEAGLDRLSKGGIDAVLLDLGLPDSSGLDTFRRIAEADGNTAVVVVSGLGDTRLAQEAVALGAQDYLVKDDATPESLCRAVTYAVSRHRIIDDLDRTRQAQLEAKDRFLSHVSHELRTPLAAVHQYVSLLADGTVGPLNDDQTECLEVAVRNIRQLVVMIDDLLTVGRFQAETLAVNVQRVRLGQLVGDSVAGFGLAAKEKGVRLRAELPALPEVACDPCRVREVLDNLVGNAVKFTPPGGSITVRASADDDRARISVRDTGPGIRPENSERVFEQFFQEGGDDGSGRAGLGLGLFVCRQLVERQGGAIWVDRHPDGGSVFAFTIPVAPRPHEGAQP